MSQADVIHIKNMVCPRCIRAVETIFKELNIPVEAVKLGEVIVAQPLAGEQQTELLLRLHELGFDLLERGKSALISKIKALIIEQIHHSPLDLKVNFSTYLADELQHDYSYLSRLFSSIEGITIKKYIRAQKIEKVKELLFYDELSLSEIAYRLQYSSVAHLSAQFKKETGMTPTAFKKLNRPGHSPLDKIGSE